MNRFFSPGRTLCRVCGKAATTCDYCDKHWQSEGKAKVLAEAAKELKIIHCEQAKEFENNLYYEKVRCV